MPDAIAQNYNQYGSRAYWGNRLDLANKSFDLTKLQRESYDWFINDGVGSILHSINPVVDFTGKNWRLEFGDYFLGKSKFTPDKCRLKGVSYDAPLRVKVTLINL